MEVLYREWCVIDVDINCILFGVPEEYVIELVPLVLLLLELKHLVDLPVDFEVLVVAESGEQDGLVSKNRRFPLPLLCSVECNLIVAPLEKLDVACVHLWRRGPAIIREVLVLPNWELEQQAVVERAESILLLVHLYRVARVMLF